MPLVETIYRHTTAPARATRKDNTLTAPTKVRETARAIQAQMIQRARAPRPCPFKGCGAYYDATTSSTHCCEYHSQDRFKNVRPCEFSGCGKLSPDLDTFGLCPEHAYGKNPIARRGTAKPPRNTAYSPPRAKKPIAITRDEKFRAEQMIERLKEGQVKRLRANPPTYPHKPGWRSSADLPSYLAGVAAAILRNHYTLIN